MVDGGWLVWLLVVDWLWLDADWVVGCLSQQAASGWGAEMYWRMEKCCSVAEEWERVRGDGLNLKERASNNRHNRVKRAIDSGGWVWLCVNRDNRKVSQVRLSFTQQLLSLFPAAIPRYSNIGR